MFFRRPRQHDLYERRIADLKESHEREVTQLMRLVEALAEQIEYLRMQVGRAHVGRVSPSGTPLSTPSPHMKAGAQWVSEDEEDIEALREFGHLSDQEVARLRDELGLPDLTTA